jgi:hypothetical protein
MRITLCPPGQAQELRGVQIPAPALFDEPPTLPIEGGNSQLRTMDAKTRVPQIHHPLPSTGIEISSQKIQPA